MITNPENPIILKILIKIMIMIKKGYKQTEVGVIPEDWEVKKLGEIAKINMGQSPSSSNYNNSALGLPLIQGNADIQNRKTIIRHYTSQITKKCNEGDTIMSVRAPVGEIARTEFIACIGRGVCAISYPNNFLYHYLIFIEPQWAKHSTGSTFDSVNSDTVRKLEIPFPISGEQTAIATALSDADALIAGLEKLIAKKRNIKQGAMQRLLSPKEGWEYCELSEAVDFLDGQRRPIKSGERALMKGIYPYYGASGIIDYINDFIFDDELILLGEDGENILSRNLPLAFKVKGKIWVNNHAHVLKPKPDFNIDYLTDFLESLDYTLLNSGTAQPKLNKQVCLKIKVAKPTLEEQTRIAAILSDMDTEITALEAKLNKYKQIKQGMMQNLLTGKIRLI